MKKYFALFVLLITINSFAQEKMELFPDNLNIQPFTANILEPKLGFLIQFSKNELRLDIGNSIDLFRYYKNENETFSLGADLFTYTLLRGETNFHFPVDAVDYLFGFNGSYKVVNENYEYGARLRISHISAHFVDGHYDGTNSRWRDDLNPRVYSREFVELMPYYKFNSLRVYTGFTYLFHVDPEYIGKMNYQFGFDYFANDFISESITPFFGYDIKLVDIDKFTANNSLSAGIKIGKVHGKGLSLYFNYYAGKSIHGEYFNFNKEYSALGINLDL
ncbi:MAG: DUF1207 domain-containing protein [Bacteroidota bacterium]